MVRHARTYYYPHTSPAVARMFSMKNWVRSSLSKKNRYLRVVRTTTTTTTTTVNNTDISTPGNQNDNTVRMKRELTQSIEKFTIKVM